MKEEKGTITLKSGLEVADNIVWKAATSSLLTIDKKKVKRAMSTIRVDRHGNKNRIYC